MIYFGIAMMFLLLLESACHKEYKELGVCRQAERHFRLLCMRRMFWGVHIALLSLTCGMLYGIVVNYVEQSSNDAAAASRLCNTLLIQTFCRYAACASALVLIKCLLEFLMARKGENEKNKEEGDIECCGYEEEETPNTTTPLLLVLKQNRITCPTSPEHISQSVVLARNG